MKFNKFLVLVICLLFGNVEAMQQAKGSLSVRESDQEARALPSPWCFGYQEELDWWRCFADDQIREDDEESQSGAEKGECMRHQNLEREIAEKSPCHSVIKDNVLS